MHEVKRKPVFIAAALVTFFALAIVALWQTNAGRFLDPPPAKQKLILAVSNTYIGSGLLYIAEEKGYFALQGLDLTLKPFTSGRDAVNAVLAQQADLATSATIPIMFSAMKGQPLSVVATIFSASRDHGIVARRDSGIDSVAALKGKTVGVTMGSDSHFVLSTMLAQHQITMQEVRVEGLAPEAMEEALRTGKVDAISTWEPGLTDARKALGENASEFRTEGGFLFDFNLAGLPDWTKANPEKVQKLLKALLMAKRFTDENPQAAHKIVTDVMQMDADIFTVQGPRYRFVVQLDQNLLIMLEDQSRWAMQGKLTKTNVMPDYLSGIDMKPLLAVKPESVTIVR